MPLPKEYKPLFIAMPFLRPFATKAGRKAIKVLASKMLISGEPHITVVGGIVATVAEVFEKIEKGE